MAQQSLFSASETLENRLSEISEQFDIAYKELSTPRPDSATALRAFTPALKDFQAFSQSVLLRHGSSLASAHDRLQEKLISSLKPIVQNLAKNSTDTELALLRKYCDTQQITPIVSQAAEQLRKETQPTAIQKNLKRFTDGETAAASGSAIIGELCLTDATAKDTTAVKLATRNR